MERETKMLDRIIALEKEVSYLRLEVQHLKQHTSFEPAKKKLTPEYIAPNKQEHVEAPVRTNPVQPEEPVLEKEKRSLEELFTRALPKIFMVILVLGVLWGLKLVSDYGFLSDNIKIIAGFVLSIGLGVCAFVMDKKKKGSRVVALSLYGGAFIVGILVTAAGAILYDVLSLYTALIIVLLYIVYGVAISYLKGNEALTALVVFTSLLLPYLLEYMEFSTTIIGIFIVLLFTVVQVVILKHKQRKALYIGMAFSVLALCILSGFHMEQLVFFAVALILLYSVFLVSYLRLYPGENKLQAGMLFSFTITVLTAVNLMLLYKDAAPYVVLLLVGILSFVTYIVFKRKDKLLLDIVATLTVLTLLTFIAQLNISGDVILLLCVIVAFAGLMLAVKHAIRFMKWMYSFVFTILGLFVFIFCDVQPVVSIEHLVQLLIIGMLVILSRTLRKNSIVLEEDSMSMLAREDVFPVLIYGTALVYIWKIDITHIPDPFTTYLTYLVIALFFAMLLVIKLDLVGRLLPAIAGSVYIVSALSLFTSVWVEEQTVMLALIMRIIYIGLLWAILVDIWKRGAIYKNYVAIIEGHTEQLTIIVMIVSIIAMFGLTNFMIFNQQINWNSAVILNTISIFIAACLSLFLAAKRDYRNLKLTGIGLLFFGIVKMIFFDLSALDLLIRSISFIIIGAIGLVISNKLLDKGKDSE